MKDSFCSKRTLGTSDALVPVAPDFVQFKLLLKFEIDQVLNDNGCCSNPRDLFHPDLAAAQIFLVYMHSACVTSIPPDEAGHGGTRQQDAEYFNPD